MMTLSQALNSNAKSRVFRSLVLALFALATGFASPTALAADAVPADAVVVTGPPAKAGSPPGKVDRASANAPYVDPDVARLLDAYPVLRIFITSAPGNGHQAATVNLMKHLRHLGYKGFFEVICADAAAGKLSYLLPGYDPTNTQTQAIPYLGGMRVILQSKFNEDESIPSLPVGLTGADDHLIRTARDLRVDYFLKLQPLEWHIPNEILRGNSRTSVELGHLKPLGVPYPVEKGGEFDQILIREMGVSPQLAAKRGGLRALMKPRNPRDLLPVYGVGIAGVNRIALLATALRTAQKSSPHLFAKGIAVPVFSELSEAELKALTMAVSKQNLFLGSIHSAMTAKKLEALEPGEIALVHAGQVTPAIFDYVFSNATLPALTAGKNATNLMRLVGKPYINVVGDVPDVAELPARDQAIVREGHEGMKTAERAFPAASVLSLAGLISEMIKVNSPIRNFYEGMQVKAASVDADKLQLGLRALIEEMRRSGHWKLSSALRCEDLFSGR